jgi:hypothetical protein
MAGYPKEPDADCGSIPKTRSVIQNDDADQQVCASARLLCSINLLFDRSLLDVVAFVAV